MAEWQRIGLVRHFEVSLGFPRGWVTARELHEWRAAYEVADIRHRPVALGNHGWARCYCSDARRARETAQAIFPGPVTPLEILREVTVQEYPTGSLRMPLTGWRLLTRLAWALNHRSQREAKQLLLGNVKAVVREHLESPTEPILLVSHGGIMWFLRRELIRLGYRGPKFSLAENGRLYVFERRV